MKYANGSIMQSPFYGRSCYLCVLWQRDYSEKSILHKHHVFMGPLRKMSEREGFFVWLCPKHHILGKHAAHRDYDVCRMLQRTAQEIYEADHTRGEFMRLTGKSYL